jgi:methionyl-tRNA synthetase
MNREKMSKSTGNVVNPFFAIDRFGMDTMRFFLAHRGGLASDSDYDNRYIIRDYKKYLQQGLGNIAHRTIGCAKGKMRDYIINATSGNSPATGDDQAYQKTLEQLSHKVAKYMEALDPRAALEEIVEVILLTNKYFHNSEPWQNPEEKQRVIFNAAESMRIMGILLQPFMPDKAKKLLDILKVDPSKRNLSDAGYAQDSTYGEDIKKKILFPPLALEN